MIAELKALTPKQRDFVLEYVKTKNGTASAIKAGYSENTAPEIASENLTKPKIQSAIQAITAPILKKQLISVEEVITEIKDIGFNKNEKTKDRLTALKALGDHAGAWKDATINLKHFNLGSILKNADEE